MTLYKVAHSKAGDLLWLDVRLDKQVVENVCQKPRIMPGKLATETGWITGDRVDRHFVIFLEKDFSMQKAFHAVNDFDVKVLSPVLGVFWVPCNYLLTLEEYNQLLLDSKEKEKKEKKNKKKGATK